MSNIIITNMCMISSGDEVLVQDRLDPAWPGITFPGGHVEDGESFADSVIREVKEETGLTISQPRLVGVKDWCDEASRYVVMLYRTESFTGELCSSEEGEVWWEHINNLKNMKLANDMDVMLKVFLEDDISEFFYRHEEGKWIQELK